MGDAFGGTGRRRASAPVQEVLGELGDGGGGGGKEGCVCLCVYV